MQIVKENIIEEMPLSTQSLLLLVTIENCIKKYQNMTSHYEHNPGNYQWDGSAVLEFPYRYFIQYSLTHHELQLFARFANYTEIESIPIILAYGLSTMTLSLFSFLYIDLPIAVLSGFVGLSTVVPVTMAEKISLIREKISKANRANYLPGTLPPSLVFLLAQHHAISMLLLDEKCNEKRLAELCQCVFEDIHLLATSSTWSTLKLGKGYLVEESSLPGLRHYITGRSRLADILQTDILAKFNFRDYLQPAFSEDNPRAFNVPTIAIAAPEPETNIPLFADRDNSTHSAARFLRQHGIFSQGRELSADSTTASCLETPKSSY
jgi:hypothetical protein